MTDQPIDDDDDERQVQELAALDYLLDDYQTSIEDEYDRDPIGFLARFDCPRPDSPGGLE